MKIIYVTASLPYGATEIFAIPEVRELVRRGHEVRLVPMSRYTETPHSDAEPFLPVTLDKPLLSVPILSAAFTEFVRQPGRTRRVLRDLTRGQPKNIVKKNRGVLPRSLWLARFARHWGADHIHGYWASIAASTAMAAGVVSGVPWSFTAHRWDIAQPNAFQAKVESAQFARFISEDGLNLARPVAGPELTRKAAIIRMGVPLDARESRRTPPPPGTDLRLICTGSLIARKGQNFLLEAAAQLKAEGINVHISLAGEGETRAALTAQAQTLGLADRVTLLGNVDHDALLKQYAAGRYDAFVLPSLHEGISVALIEAMSYGLPAVATDVGGTRELLTEGAGLLIPARDVGALVGALRSYAQNEPKRLEFGLSGRQRVMAEYDIEVVVDALESRFYASAGTVPTIPEPVLK